MSIIIYSLKQKESHQQIQLNVGTCEISNDSGNNNPCICVADRQSNKRAEGVNKQHHSHYTFHS